MKRKTKKLLKAITYLRRNKATLVLKKHKEKPYKPIYFKKEYKEIKDSFLD